MCFMYVKSMPNSYNVSVCIYIIYYTNANDFNALFTSFL